MESTIRDVIKRRVRWFYGAAAAGFVLVMVGVGDKTPVPIELVAWALLFGGTFSAQWLVQCPRCSTRLGQLAATIGFNWTKRRTVRFCPYCGVSLDEPVPHKAIE
jgi:hypothetical protein